MITSSPYLWLVQIHKLSSEKAVYKAFISSQKGTKFVADTQHGKQLAFSGKNLSNTRTDFSLRLFCVQSPQ